MQPIRPCRTDPLLQGGQCDCSGSNCSNRAAAASEAEIAGPSRRMSCAPRRGSSPRRSPGRAVSSATIPRETKKWRREEGAAEEEEEKEREVGGGEG
eukprot:328750-Pyramimonas_sp.AAC.1